MDITISITDTPELTTAQLMDTIAAANGWPRGDTANTVERVNLYILRTVGQWVKSGTEIVMRETAEAEVVSSISKAVAITVK